jgi:hypothetical protein
MLTITGFLYAICGVLIQKEIDVSQKLSDTLYNKNAKEAYCYLQFSHLDRYIIEANIFILLMSIIGIYIGTTSYLSISAAMRAVDNLDLIYSSLYGRTRAVRYKIDNTFVIGDENQAIIVPSIAGGGSNKSAFRGSLLAFFIPVCVGIGWITIIVIAIFSIFGHYVGIDSALFKKFDKNICLISENYFQPPNTWSLTPHQLDLRLQERLRQEERERFP